MRAKLSELGTVITGNTPSKQESKYWASSDIPFIKPDVINQDGITELQAANEYISEIARSKARIVEKSVVLVTCIGSIVKICLTGRECAFNQQINAIIPNDKVLPEYLAYCIYYNRPGLIELANAPVVPIINKRQFENFSVNIEENIGQQGSIVTILKAVDRLIYYRHKQLQKLDELVKARFVELFGMINEDVSLSYYIASLNAGKSLAGEEENPNKVLKTGAVTYDYFDATQIKNLPMDYEPQEGHRVKVGDVIISRMNTAELVGAASYVWDVPEHIYLPDRLWRAEIKETANPIFVWQVLIQRSTKKSIRRIASGTSGSMKNISKPGLLGIRVVKAPIKLQEQFAAFVEQTDKSKVAIQKALDEAQLLFDSLMQKYFG